MQENRLATLREMLLQPPTSNLWWECVELVELCEDIDERELLRSYLQDHSARDQDWSLCRVPCGDWLKDFEGHALCHVSTQPLRTFAQVEEHHCPPGHFMMGCSPGDETDSYEYEHPRRKVTLTRGFWALNTPVTQALYEAVMGKNPSEFKDPQQPVETLNWYEAIVFCNALSKQSGLSPAYEIVGFEEWSESRSEENQPEVSWDPEADGYRLPTEAEWEYMCRAGSPESRYGSLHEVSWSNENTKEIQKVALKKPNAWGLYDTLGNVWEWCWDVFYRDAYTELPDVDPWYHEDRYKEPMMLRGGCWYYSLGGVRASFRVSRDVWYSSNYIGLRPVRNTK